MTTDGSELRIIEHLLLAVDADGALCACGERFPLVDFLEHLGDVALMVLEAGPSADERREQKYRDEYQRRLGRQRAIAESDAARAHRVLDEMQAEHERRWEQLEQTGLTTFLERDAWLIAHRTPDETRAARHRQEAQIQDAIRLVGVTPIRRTVLPMWSEAERRTA